VEATRPRPRRERLLFVAVLAALALPLAVMAVRVLAHNWSNPGGDLSLIELRTRDVGAHTPLLGSYGRYGFNQPGPLWFYALALPYRAFGSNYAGLQIGVLAVNAAAVVTMLVIARRRGGLVLTMIVAALLALLLRGFGAQWLADPWEPHGLTLLCAALLFLAWDAAVDGPVSLVATVVVAALLAEAQAGLVLYAAAMVAVAATGTIVRLRRSPPESSDRRVLLRSLMIAGGLLLVLALPPFLALVRGESGNVVDLVRSMRHPSAAVLGVPDGWRAVVGELGRRAPWLAGNQPLEAFSTTVDAGHEFPLPIGLLAFAGVGALAVRARDRSSILFVVVAAGLVAAVLSLARLLGPLFFWIPEWTRALGFGAAVAVLWGGYEWAKRRWNWRRSDSVVVPALATLAVVVALVCTVDAIRSEPLPNPSVDAVHRLAAAALPQVKDGTSFVTATKDPTALLGSDPGTPTLVLDLERAGADVVVDPSLADHYGDHRSDPSRARARAPPVHRRRRDTGRLPRDRRRGSADA
jgi:hypothetical protein